MNKVVLIGRLSREPELRHTTSGTPVCQINIAINRPVSQGSEPQTDFINVVLWNKQAENVAKYVTKGGQVAVEGRIQTRSYENSEGKKTFVTEVIANNVEFLQTKKNDTTKTNEENTSETTDPYAEFGNSIKAEDLDIGMELPF